MSLFPPRNEQEAQWQQWNYGGGASRGEPMPNQGPLGGFSNPAQTSTFEPRPFNPGGDPLLQELAKRIPAGFKQPPMPANGMLEGGPPDNPMRPSPSFVPEPNMPRRMPPMTGQFGYGGGGLLSNMVGGLGSMSSKVGSLMGPKPAMPSFQKPGTETQY